MEAKIIGAVKEELLNTENLAYIYDQIEKIVKKGLNQVPEEIKEKKGELDKAQIEINNFLNFIKAGNFSKAVSEALSEAEKRAQTLKDDIEMLEVQKHKEFIAPPPEWLNTRFEKLCDTLNQETRTAALALKALLGKIELEPISEAKSNYYEMEFDGIKKFKPFYVAHTRIRTLALLDEEVKGSNWYQWCTRRDLPTTPRLSWLGCVGSPLSPDAHIPVRFSLRAARSLQVPQLK